MKNENFFSETGHLSETGIALYLDALKLNRIEELPEKIVNHVASCTECKLHILELEAILQPQTYDTKQMHPYFDSKRKIQRVFSPLRIAAGFLIAVLLGGIYYATMKNETTPQEKIAKNTFIAETTAVIQTIPEQQKSEDIFAANFESSVNFEELVAMEFRSTTFEVITPRNNDLVKQPVAFRWKPYNKPLKLTIFSNKDVAILTVSVAKNFYTSTKTFNPGLYYWKLQTDEELVFVGKFIVR